MYQSDNRQRAKSGYPTLAEALAARTSISRKKGKRFRALRPYQYEGRWYLTKFSRTQQEFHS